MTVKKSWYEENGRYFNIDGTEVISKNCTECGEEKLIGDFRKRKKGRFGVYNKCKDCQSKYSNKYIKEHRENNREYYKEYKKEYRENNKEAIAKKMKEYREKNREYFAERSKELYKTPQGREDSRRRSNKRRTLKENNGGSYTCDQWEHCKDFFNNTCAYSGQPITLNNSHVEHIVPLSKGGTSYIWNLCTSLDIVNKSKSNKEMEEWYRKQEYFTEERLQKIYEWQDYAYDKYSMEYDSELEAV